ncbi:MAG: phenylacetate--CoA ligase family protein [Thaumarchaeota archaeon]|nr:phenylacetate--CoA ligase family protein [Nitrososphaerota archaeon]
MLARFAYFYLQSLGTWRLPRDKLRELQGRKLRRTVRNAYAHLPMYRSAFDEAGITPSGFAGVESLARLPQVTKRDIIANYPQGVRRPDIRAALVRTGSGTTGVKSETVWSSEQLDLNHALLSRRLTMAGVRPWTKIASLWPPRSNWRKEREGSREAVPTTTLSWRTGFSTVARNLPNVRGFFISYDLTAGEARGLARFAPDFIQGNPSYLRRVGEGLRRHGVRVNPRAVICANENFTSTVRRELADLFDCSVLNAIGATEMGVVGSECESQTGLHLNEDYMVCEVLRDDEPVSPGEVGELVMTSLHNDAMPFIRYRTGDLVELGSASRCSCGSSLMRISRIVGRTGEGLSAASGERILPMDLAEEVERYTHLRDYQIVQTEARQFTLRLAPGGDSGPEDTDRVKALLEDRLGGDVSVRVEMRGEDEVWQKGRPVLTKLTS